MEAFEVFREDRATVPVKAVTLI